MMGSSRGSRLCSGLHMGTTTRLIKFAPVALAIFAACVVQVVAAVGAKAEAAPMRIVALGDSLTAGLGLPPGQGFVAVLQQALKSRGHNVEVVDAGVSGDTTAAALARLDWVIGEPVDAMIVELGANDALRGQPPAQAKANLDEILKRLGARRLPVLLAGMRAPENWGPEYREQFDAIFPALAEAHGAILYPFFLDGVALERELNQPDGMHPNARGVATIVERLLPYVEKLIGRVEANRKASVAGRQ